MYYCSTKSIETHNPTHTHKSTKLILATIVSCSVLEDAYNALMYVDLLIVVVEVISPFNKSWKIQNNLYEHNTYNYTYHSSPLFTKLLSVCCVDITGDSELVSSRIEQSVGKSSILRVD